MGDLREKQDGPTLTAHPPCLWSKHHQAGRPRHRPHVTAFFSSYVRVVTLPLFSSGLFFFFFFWPPSPQHSPPTSPHRMTARGAERRLEWDSGYLLWDQSRWRAVGTKSSSLAGKRFQGRFYGRLTAVNAASSARSPTGRRRRVCFVSGGVFFFFHPSSPNPLPILYWSN